MAALAPVAALCLLECGLRIAGIGYPTTFLLPAEQGETQVWVPNPRFTWRFFGPERARRPAHFELARSTSPNTVRIFIFGESAAFGDPDARFGLSRMLQAILELRYPEAGFEVVNAAITGINSHTIVEIARDCSSADGDVWVTYIGNNEVVGPFGAGTVFGPQAPPLPVIRARLALLETRVGQAGDVLLRRLRPLPPDKRVWGGLLMFAENQVPAQDPRLDAVYHHFERNLNDLLDIARANGVRVVMSTVAVNLRDGGPFASVSRDGLGPGQHTNWQALVGQGGRALADGRPADALAVLRDAAAIDDSAADLHYLRGHALLAEGRTNESRTAFTRARDLDALRFRCDSRLNEITRGVAAQHGENVVLVDAERDLAADHAPPIAGADLFYDHVHLTFEGNHRLATLIAEEVELMLPEAVRSAGLPDWPSVEACAERLAWTATQDLRVRSTMLGRYRQPPFSFQRDHEAQMRRQEEAVVQLTRNRVGSTADAEAGRRALALAPEDATLHAMLAETRRTAHDYAGAAEAAQRAVELAPNHRDAWILLGAILTDQGDGDAAATALRRAGSMQPDDGMADYFLGRAMAESDRPEEAEQALRRAITTNPRLGPAYLELASLLEGVGRKEEADDAVRDASVNRVLTVEFLSSLVEACMSRSWHAEALSAATSAIDLSAGSSVLHLQAGECLDAMGDPDLARAHYQQAVALAPNMGRAQHMLGLSYARADDIAGAAEHFSRAAELLPDVAGIHLNLAQAQALLGRREAAMQSLEQVLRLESGHPEAERRLAELRTLQEP